MNAMKITLTKPVRSAWGLVHELTLDPTQVDRAAESVADMPAGRDKTMCLIAGLCRQPVGVVEQLDPVDMAAANKGAIELLNVETQGAAA